MADMKETSRRGIPPPFVTIENSRSGGWMDGLAVGLLTFPSGPLAAHPIVTVLVRARRAVGLSLRPSQLHFPDL